MDELTSILLSWAVTLSGYPPPTEMPEVVMVPYSYLAKAACGEKQCRVLGWFPPGRRIYLDGRLSPQDSTFASSILVHELVHYLQHESAKFGSSYSCESAIAMEREAYSVQREFLLRYGVYQPIGLSMHQVGCELTAQQPSTGP